METVVVTRHPGLVAYLKSSHLVPKDVEVIEHATEVAVSGRHVIGVLPQWLAVEAEIVTEIPMTIPAEWRGRELTEDETRACAGPPRSYQVREVYIDRSASPHLYVCYQVQKPHNPANIGDGWEVLWESDRFDGEADIEAGRFAAFQDAVRACRHHARLEAGQPFVISGIGEDGRSFLPCWEEWEHAPKS